MQPRKLGRTGLDVAALSFGCGAVGGLMVRGTAAEQERAVARAIEIGVRYFDTAPQYGDGVSEQNLGRILAKPRPAVHVGTKVRIKESDYGRIGQAITESIEASLRRLGRDSVDLFQLHNRIAERTAGDALSVDAVLGEVAPAFERLRREGKIRHSGITALGETAALTRVVDAGAFDVAQVCYNALNPTAAATLPSPFPGQDFGRLLDRAKAQRMGSIGIRILAGGALSGSEARHPVAMPDVAPIGSGADYATDVARARRFATLVRDGFGRSLSEIAVRFAISTPALSTVLIGIATPEEFEAAAAAVEKGPLPAAALTRIGEIQAAFATADG